MKTAYLFHDVGCCLTDCMVRECTCEVEPVPGPDAQNEGEALRMGARLVDTVREDGASVDWLSGRVDEMEGLLHLHFVTSREGEDDNDEN